ncbi:MAG TPA: metal ABC transporter permease, partial [Candidatus Bathyarchaeota archaeon]|nr:metal ABC transporter permease [Candidatus Bathyarchaeota archaeon]
MANRGSYLLKAIRLLTPAVLALATALMAFYVNARWVAVMVSAALAYGFLSSIVAARRLYFLAGASAHSALLAAVLALPLTAITGLLSEQGWALIVGLVLMYAVGYLIYRGVEPDTATAVFVAATASASVLAIYYVLTRFPVEVELWAIIVGDPLLASKEEAIFALSVAAITVLTTLLTYREQVYVGIDREFARLTGLRVWAYDLLTFTLLALTTVGLIKVV